MAEAPLREAKEPVRRLSNGLTNWLLVNVVSVTARRLAAPRFFYCLIGVKEHAKFQHRAYQGA